MYTMSHLLIALFIGGGIGGFIGWYVAMNNRGDNKRKVIMDLESQLDQAAQSRADYEAEVTEHFAQTADLSYGGFLFRNYVHRTHLEPVSA